MAASTATPARPRDAQAIGYTLFLIMLAMVLIGVGLAYGIDAARRAVHAGPAGTADSVELTRTIGGRDLTIPVSWFRYAEQRVEGFASQVDLQLRLPLGRNKTLSPVDVTLLPRSRTRVSAALLDGVYLHMFQNVQLQGPPGLIGKPLRPVEGFASETVWYDALSINPFVAKCSAPVSPASETRCIRTVALGPGLAAVYSFSGDVLENWRDFDPEMAKRLTDIGVF
jgi:hypothetical protein